MNICLVCLNHCKNMYCSEECRALILKRDYVLDTMSHLQKARYVTAHLRTIFAHENMEGEIL